MVILKKGKEPLINYRFSDVEGTPKLSHCDKNVFFNVNGFVLVIIINNDQCRKSILNTDRKPILIWLGERYNQDQIVKNPPPSLLNFRRDFICSQRGPFIQ